MTDVLAALQDRSFAQATAATASSYPPRRRLTGGHLADYLGRRAFAVIGSGRPDDRAHCGHVLVHQARDHLLAADGGRIGAEAQRAPPALADRDGHRK